MKVAVTGAGGFLGRQVVQVLCEAGYSVLAFTSQDFTSPSDVCSLIDYAPREESLVPARLRGVDVLVNCAFPRQARGRDLAAGLDYIRTVFEASSEAMVGAIVNVSSQSVYDSGRWYAADEHSPIVLDSPYAVAKYSTELLLSSSFSRSNAIDIRLSSLIGPGFDARLVNKMIAGALTAGRIRVAGGNQQYDFMDVADAAAALRKTVDNQLWRNTDVLNVGSSHAVSLSHIALVVAEEVGRVLGRKIQIETDDDVSAPVVSSSLDCTLFLTLSDFEPQYSLSDSVQAIVRHQLAATTQN